MIKAYYNERLLGIFDTIESAMKSIYADIYQHNIKSYYQRVWVQSDYTIVVDYGSWSDFYYIKGASEDIVNAWIMRDNTDGIRI